MSCREVGKSTYLYLISVDLDSTLDCFLHVLCVEIAKAKMLNSAVLLEVFQGIDILGVIVLNLVLAKKQGDVPWQAATHKLPVELQQVDTIGA